MSPLCQLEMTLPGGIPGVFGATVRRMSDGELSRIEVLRDVDRKRLTSTSVAQLLRLEPGIPPVEGLPSRGASRREHRWSMMVRTKASDMAPRGAPRLSRHLPPHFDRE